MMKRDIEQSDATQVADGSRPKRRREMAGGAGEGDISMKDVTVIGNEDGGEKESMETVKEQGLRLWQMVRDAVNKDGRTLSLEFLKKPAKRLYPDYYHIIKQPIALDDIKKQLDNNAYPTLEAVRADFELCFTNAKTYNMKESDIWKDAKDLLKLVNKTYQKMIPSDEDGENVDGEKKGKTKAPNLNRLIKSRLQKLVDKTNDFGRILSTEFMELPSKKEWPMYYKEIKRPQCLENIFKRIKRKEYSSAVEFAADVELVFSNAMTFNVEHTLIWEDARVLRDYFRQLMSDLPPPFALPEYSKPSTTKIKIKPQTAQQTTATSPTGGQVSGSSSVSSPVVLRVPASGTSPSVARSQAQPAAVASTTATAPPVQTTNAQLQRAVNAQSPQKGSSTTPQPTAQSSMQSIPQPLAGFSHYPNASYHLSTSTTTTTTANTATATPAVPSKPSTVVQSHSPSPSVTSGHQLKYVSLWIQPHNRKLCLDYRDGVKSWAMRLSPQETEIIISDVMFLHDEEEESSGEEEAEPELKQEEEEEEVAEEVPVKNGRKKGKAKAKGRPHKVQVKTTAAKPKPASSAGSKNKTAKMAEVQVKLNGLVMKGEEEKEGRWTLSLQSGTNVLEIGEAGGTLWKVYAERAG
ncbi:hypothetical protein AMATHDRAFT_57287 [Amanita thiersii Skay4041]|uniref:Bromo domain-containing protein n=1 Tax=Amanita thiersii Skay4041 TaxID=703135 RepID=A0A2A9NQ78_9AGAR|nr:hypothetical protein AMATHDRAFT_57287 [Amanita thiersii Skay4041]